MPFPRDASGRVIAGPGRPKGLPDVRVRLAKDACSEAFARLGGVDALVAWVEEDKAHRRIFYGSIWPRLMPAQAVEAAAQKLSERPVINEIRNLVVTPDGRMAEVGATGFQPVRPP